MVDHGDDQQTHTCVFLYENDAAKSVTQGFEQWMWSTRVNYQLQFSEQNYFQPFEPFGDFF